MARFWRERSWRRWAASLPAVAGPLPNPLPFTFGLKTTRIMEHATALFRYLGHA